MNIVNNSEVRTASFQKNELLEKFLKELKEKNYVFVRFTGTGMLLSRTGKRR